MQKLFLQRALLLVLFITGIGVVSAQQQKPTFKVSCIGFYNLENLFDTIPGPNDTEFTPEGSKRWNSERYRHKLKHMAEVIVQIGSEMFPGGPAVLGVSEVENRSVLEDLITTPPLKASNYKIIHYDSPGYRGIDVALLYRPQFFRVLSSRSVRLTIPDKPYFKTRDQLVVTGLLDGDTIHLIVNHWPSRRGGEKRSLPYRMAAAKLARSIIDSIRSVQPGARVILMGDLNDDPDSKSVAKGLGAKGSKKHLKPDDLFDPMFELYRQGIGTLAYRDSWNLFDNFIVTPPLVASDRSAWVIYRAKIFNKPFLQQTSGRFAGYPFRTYVGGNFMGGYSDHFPVYLILIKEKR